MIITIPAIDKKSIADYCHANISPRGYYLHDRIGGKGWSIYGELVSQSLNRKRQHTKWQLEVEDDYQAVIIRLKWGV
jgi:hypothetical protein